MSTDLFPGSSGGAVPSGDDHEEEDDPFVDALRDAFGVQGHADADDGDVDGATCDTGREAHDFFELLEESDKPLYPGCENYSKLSFLTKMYHIKCLHKVSDTATSLILELLHDAFPYAEITPSFYEAKKIISKIGLDYQKIDACTNDCMLYIGDDADREACKWCNESRYITEDNEEEGDVATDPKTHIKRPAKILRYFPLKPRLRRLFQSSKTAGHMRWHADHRSQDDMLRHPRDGDAWKTFDRDFPDFAADPRNVRLSLASDGFNPYGKQDSKHSIWPVVLIPYNLPPWMCMKPDFFIVSLIIPGKKSPGNDIDVYLQPLVAELIGLWEEGMKAYDAVDKSFYNLRAALMWTISDFLGLGALSGWNTYTGYACPVCNFDTDSVRLKHSRKWCFMGHRRFLDAGHRFRLQHKRINLLCCVFTT